VARSRRIAVVLLTLAWSGIAAALIAVPFTPARYCVETGTPAGLVVSYTALIVAFAVVCVGMLAGWHGDLRVATFVTVLAVAVSTIGAISAVGIYVDHHAGDGSWCD
jgi:hypothetical protein